ncbi:hypothetical protein LTR12_000347 [Friedmanniomyces endolithicus]|nr:hypothetical protein LTR74_007802 [Friedmanniomyces endolithicus]KAK1825545.1 hypothetical protein LTR12_000347 [Friedmanniomyces endolithicus]
MLHQRLRRGPRNDIPIPSLRRLEFEFRRWRVQRGTLEELGQQFKLISPWKRSMINFFTLISFTEAVRLKCGSSEGLLSFVLSPLEWIRNALVHKQSPPAPVIAPQPKMSPEEDMAQRLELTATTDEAGNMSYDPSKLNAAPGAGEPSAYFDSSLQTEGLGWFVDLTAADATFILPILLWLSVSANIIFQRTAGRPKKVVVPTTARVQDATSQSPELKADKTFDTGALSPEALRTLTAPPLGSNSSDNRFLGFLPPITNLQRIQLCIALVILSAMLKIPAAIFLYFIPSLANTTDQQVTLVPRVSINSNELRTHTLLFRPYTCAIKSAYDTVLAVIEAVVTIRSGDIAAKPAYLTAKGHGPATATMTVKR